MSAKVKRISVTIDRRKSNINVSRMTIRVSSVVGLIELNDGSVRISYEDVYGHVTSVYIEEDYQYVFTQIESFDII